MAHAMSSIFSHNLSLYAIAFAPLLLLLPFRRTGNRPARPNCRFLLKDPDTAEVVTPPVAFSNAVSLAENAIFCMRSRVSLQLSIDSIFLELQKAVHLSQPLPAHVKEWTSWLSSKRLAIVFCQYSNASRWGWVSEEDSVSDTPDYDFSILLDLAKLTDATRTDHKLPVEYFRFCYALTAGEGFEMELLGGRLVCAWDSGHVSEFRHLHDLYLVRPSGEFYRLDEDDINDFLRKIQNPSSNAVFKIDLSNKTPAKIPATVTLTVSEAQRRERTYGPKEFDPSQTLRLFPQIANFDDMAKALTDEDDSLVYTRAGTGLGKCYPRTLAHGAASMAGRPLTGS
ncbi:hypothetical protein DFH06DRAFT_1199458 [Mycena polygramma]|nr:hypothetical protein DFH06DRAFT_1199458 [Mycena polygramma]